MKNMIKILRYKEYEYMINIYIWLGYENCNHTTMVSKL